MGNDGGSIPKRHELVKNAARKPTVSELKATAHESQAHAWTHCYLTDAPLDLTTPPVSDSYGRLYNHEAILSQLLPDDTAESADPLAVAAAEQLRTRFATLEIASTRDIVRLQFDRGGSKGDGTFRCPISMKELGPSTRAVYIVPCGHVFAEQSIKQITESICPTCSETFLPRDVIPLLPTTEADADKLSKRREELRSEGLTHSLKKEKSAKKKSKKDKKNGDEEKTETRGAKRKATEDLPKADKRVSGINNTRTAALTKQILEEQEAREKSRKVATAARR